MNIVIIGSTGLVGLSFIDYLLKYNLSDNMFFVSSERSKGKIITFKDKDYQVITLEQYFEKSNNNYTIFINCGNNYTSKLIEKFLNNNNGIMIDNSSEFRMDSRYPLIVPHINFNDFKFQKVIGNPNCSTIILTCLIKPLFHLKIKKINVSTYQAVSGAGKEGIQELSMQAKASIENKELKNNVFKYTCFNNCFVHDSEKTESGYSKEEIKMILETNKIFNSKIKINCTCVRVPVKRSHCLSVSIEFFENQEKENILKLIDNDSNLVLMKDKEPDSLISSNQEKVFVGHIRKDFYDDNIYHFYISGDQILRGASYNAFKIFDRIYQSVLFN